MSAFISDAKVYQYILQVEKTPNLTLTFANIFTKTIQ